MPRNLLVVAEVAENRDYELIGPGIITGASDDDPSGIATYSQVGAQFGFGMLWTVLLCYPLMTAIQEICARLGRVTGSGLAANLKEHFPRPFLVFIVSLVLIANVFNIAADILALGSASSLILPGDGRYYSIALTIVSIALQVFVPFHRYVFVLKWLTFSLLSYIATLFIVDVPWREVITATFFPHFAWSADYLIGVVAVLGTTISPYLFFWQAAEEVEEEHIAKDEHDLLSHPGEGPFQLHRIHLDTLLGMGAATIVFYCIILTVAVTLHQAGINDIATAAQAAEALRPLAGRHAEFFFALGIIGTGLLAIPVLAGSAAYAVGESIGINVGLENSPREAKGFYGLIVGLTVVALLFSLGRENSIKMLFWSAVINGVAAGPIMVAVMLVSQNSKFMGDFAVRGWLRFAGWAATCIMLAAALGMGAYFVIEARN